MDDPTSYDIKLCNRLTGAELILPFQVREPSHLYDGPSVGSKKLRPEYNVL